MNDHSKRPTLADVAREAGVSVQTVSNVLSNNSSLGLTEKTRAKVIEAATKIGYRPNRLAQAMRAGKTNLVSIWISLDRPVLLYLLVLHEMYTQSRETDYELMISGYDDTKLYVPGKNKLLSWPVDGIIAYDADVALSEFRSDPNNNSVPIVSMGLVTYENSDRLIWNAYDASFGLMRRLISKGRRRIVHVTPSWAYDLYSTEPRRLAYETANSEAGLENRIIPVEVETAESAYHAILKFFESGGMADAFVCFSDMLAIGVAKAAQLTGSELGQEVDVWGYGDVPEAAYCATPISTLRVPVKEITAKAWNHLMTRIEDPTLEHRFEVVQMDYIERCTGKL